MEVIVERCAGLDVHKDTVMACVRRPGAGVRRHQEVREFRTFSSSLRDWLAAEGVTQVAMEATGVYWRPVWDVLDLMSGAELLLCNAHHVKNLPGRKTDVGDAAWLAQLLECGLLRGSFVAPPAIARLRDLTRYRKKLVEERTREIQRVQKLETAGIKLDSVVSDVMGKSSRDMLDALVAGVRDVDAMAKLARASLKRKIPALRLALEGGFIEHHALMLGLHLAHIDQVTASIERLDVEVDREMAPFPEPLRRLCTIPGVGKRTAEVVVAEIGVDMSRFPTAGHLASWAGMCPGNSESAGKRRTGKARKGNQALRSALCEAAWCASRAKNTYLQAQYRRFCRRFGTRNEAKAIFAVAHSMLVIIWHLLAAEVEEGTGEIVTYTDLGADWFDKRNDEAARTRKLVQQLEQLGHTVTLDPAA